MAGISGYPTVEVVPPAFVVGLAAGRRVDAVWVNGIGGTTYRLGDGTEADHAEYVKVLPPEHAHELEAEAARLTWAGAHVRVPEVVDHGVASNGDAWLRTRAIPGWSAIDPRWCDDPRTAAIAVGEGLRALHDGLPVDGCPFVWSTAQRIARSGVDDDRVAALGPEPPTSRIVVCHGDACTPNTLIGADGRWIGHVDLGALGVADRWADLAVATMAFGWNHGPGWDDVVLDAYGVEPDRERSDWYRRLWNLDDESADPI